LRSAPFEEGADMKIFRRFDSARFRRVISHPVSQAALFAVAVVIVAAFVLPSGSGPAAPGGSSEIELERADNLALRGALERAKDLLAHSGFSQGKPGGATPDAASLILSPLTHGCDRIETIVCGQTRSDDLTTASCLLNDGSYTEFYSFFGTSGQTVTVDMMSTAFDTFLFLLNPTPTVVATDDDGGGGTNSRIVFTLNVTGTWTIAVNSFLPNQFGPYTVSLACGTPPPPPPPTGCSANATTLCLNNNRFRVQVNWASTTASGAGMAVPETSDTGMFWFFSANNLEAIIKVVNGCSFNSRYWVFAGGLTNVQVTITVTDTQTQTVRTYTNPQGAPFQPIQDTSAFATCP